MEYMGNRPTEDFKAKTSHNEDRFSSKNNKKPVKIPQHIEEDLIMTYEILVKEKKRRQQNTID